MSETGTDKAQSESRVALQTVLWLAVVAVCGAAVYGLVPRVLPAYLDEGPLVQNAGTDAVTLVWYTSAPAECTLTVTIDETPREVPVASGDTRHVAVVEGLAADEWYPYTIAADGRALGTYHFRTNKAAGQPFSFVVFGDSGKGKQEQYTLAGVMEKYEPEFLLHTGDVVYPDGDRDDYAWRFFLPYRGLVDHVCFWPSLGNHDVDETGAAPAYVEVFELPVNGPRGGRPDHDYWFDYADARIAVIDSNVDAAALRERTVPWLREVLGDPHAPAWKFVVLHHPPYTGGKYMLPNPKTQAIHETLPPVFDEVGVDVVFAGHDHNYQRMLPLRGGEIVEDDAGGVLYITSGAGGARLYERDAEAEPPPYLAMLYNEKHSFTHVEVDGDVLRVRQINIDDEVVDEVTHVRQPGVTTAPSVTSTP